MSDEADDRRNELCLCGHKRKTHRGGFFGGACWGCITPDGGTLCWRFRKKIEPETDQGKSGA